MDQLGARRSPSTSTKAVYGVEDQWAATLARGGRIDFFGSMLSIPMERRFGDLESVRRYVAAVTALPSVRVEFPAMPPLAVRERRGQTQAHYEPEALVIAIPVGQTWALRETVVLHEIAHHASCSQEAWDGDWHGVRFRAAMCSLVRIVLGDEAALLLRSGYEEAGLATVASS